MPEPPAPPPPPPQIKERRRHSRFGVVDVEIELRKRGLTMIFAGSGGNSARGIANLSEGGAAIYVAEEIPVDTEVRFRIKIPKFQDELAASGIVRWCRAQPTGDAICGIAFDKMTDADRRKLANLKSYFTSPQVMAKMREKRESTTLYRRPPAAPK